jgi:N-carbamoylputrescine amidase
VSEIHVAVIQYQSEVGHVEENVTRSLFYLDKASQEGVQLAVLPELCQSGYDLTPDLAKKVAESITGETVNRWVTFAKSRQLYLVAGLCELAGKKIYNSAVLIGPQGYIGTYRKAHLFYHEKDVFAPGDSGFPVFDLEWGRIGLLICYDLRFPESLRMLALQKTELVCVPTAWVTPKGKKWDDRGYCMQAYCAMAQASINRFYMACADTFGEYRNTQFLGGSLIIGPDGWPITGPAAIDRPEILFAKLDLADARTKSHNPANDLLMDRRIDIYGDYPIKNL